MTQKLHSGILHNDFCRILLLSIKVSFTAHERNTPSQAERDRMMNTRMMMMQTCLRRTLPRLLPSRWRLVASIGIRGGRAVWPRELYMIMIIIMMTMTMTMMIMIIIIMMLMTVMMMMIVWAPAVDHIVLPGWVVVTCATLGALTQNYCLNDEDIIIWYDMLKILWKRLQPSRYYCTKLLYHMHV